jgi:signal transduction histidine kinase/ActR/RegA family two-component response regulator
MEKKSLAQSLRSVLACLAKKEHLPLLQDAISGLGSNAEICRDVAELCSKISDQIDAVVISGDLLSDKAIQMIAKTLDTQPELSDLPMIAAIAGNAAAPIAADVLRELGFVLFLDDPFTPAELKAALQAAFGSRERQRRIFDLEKECARATRALQESRNQLEQKVQERTRELAENASQLRKLTGELILSEQRERSRLAMILHDHLQQLLVSAKYRISSLNRVEDPDVRETVREVQELLGEVIDASRSLTSELSPPIVHESRLRTAMEWLVSFMAAQNAFTVQLKMEEDVRLIDENTKVLLFESTRELLLNAFKHAQVRSAGVRVRKIEGDKLEIVVADQGTGFNPASLKHSGFGLFRIRERLRLIGGHLEIDSSPHNGSRFTIVAPLEAAQFRSVPPATDSLRQSEGTMPRPERPVSGTIRVLIADDHAVMRQGLSTSLKQEPDIVIVGEAVDGEMALEKARTLRPDIVLMDLGMPKMNGIEATQKIHTEMPKVRVIGLSMFEEKEGAKAMFDVGAVAYLSKSCSVDALTATIRRCVGKPGLRS